MFWQKIHKWLSLPLGIVLFVVCATGSLLSFERELTGLFSPAETGRLEFFRTVENLHRSLAMGRTGRLIVGIAVLAMLIILISGLVMLINRAKRSGLRRNLSLTFPTPLRGMHIAPGAYFMVIPLLCGLTGLTWSFGWFRDAFYFLFDRLSDQPLFHTIHALHTGRIGGLPGRILWCIGSLVAASLPLTGYCIFLRKERAKHSRTK